MWRLLGIAFGLLAWIGISDAREPSRDQNWVRYENARFGFKLEYPAGIFEIERTSEAGDGQVFLARDSHARLLVGAFPNADAFTPRTYQDFIARRSYSDFEVGYRQHGSTWSVLSGEGGGRIFYEKVMFSCGGRLINSFALIYPKDSRQVFDPIIERIEDTFQPGRKTCPADDSANSETSVQGDGERGTAVRRSSSAGHSAPLKRTAYPRSALADQIARERGRDVLVVMRRVGPPYDYKVLRGYASR